MNKKNKEKKFLKNLLLISFYLLQKFRRNSIELEGAKELAQVLKSLINLKEINLDYENS
jgi:hypothetical protein